MQDCLLGADTFQTYLAGSRDVLQELFPESYAETAGWLRREVSANQDSLDTCTAQLQELIDHSPEFNALAVSCQVSLCHSVYPS